MNRTVSKTNYTHEMIVPENLDPSSRLSQKSARLQMCEIRRSMITKNHAICQGWHFSHMWKALT